MRPGRYADLKQSSIFHIAPIKICGLTNTAHLTDLYFLGGLVNCEQHEFVTHSIFQMGKSKRNRQHSLQ